MIQQPRVAIVILNWNTSNYLQQFLPAALAATYQQKEIFVIDNNSTDDSISLLRSSFPSVNIIEVKENLGFAGGYNVGLAQIRADYYMIVNSDLEVTPGFIEPLVKLMEGNQNIAACQPKLLSLDDKGMFEYAGAAGGWIDKWGFPFTRGRVLTTIEEDQGQYDSIAPVFWASGACMCLRASAFKETGGFYDYYYMQQEDIDLCWRLQNMGYAIYSCPESVVYHMGGGTLSWENHLKTLLTFRNNYIMLSRNLPPAHASLLVAIRLILDAFGCIYFLLLGKFGISRAIFLAAFAFFKWLLFKRHMPNQQPKGWRTSTGIYEGTILFRYFIYKKRKFSELVTSNRVH